MSIKLSKIGNSRGFVVPKAVLEALHWADSDDYEATLAMGGVLFNRVKPTKPTLNLFAKAPNDDTQHDTE